MGPWPCADSTWRSTDTLPRVPELQLDGIVGPTHNYAGLSLGNVASNANQGSTSRPRSAALQGLTKMEAIASLGIPQGFLPPQERPHLPTLRALGYSGRDEQVLERVAREEPTLLAAVSSASSMWAANAATVTPSVDARDGRVHFTPANLRSMFHRSLEPATTAAALAAAFPDRDRVVVHDPLPSTGPYGDEGAANHTRLVRGADAPPQPAAGPRGASAGARDAASLPGVHFFVFGAAIDASAPAPSRYPARQDERASRAIARRHAIDPASALFARQRPESIDRGVFHNDVICVGNESLLLVHEHAFVDQSSVLERLASLVDDGGRTAGSSERRPRGGSLRIEIIRADEISVDDAVRTYLFNSQ
ncbi:MAG: N-succinylarginine dihydrolase, partial [Phycisphaerae bacterium]|nr:N-succinylarginine dihydrolase [Phycisphaerae bacterium]